MMMENGKKREWKRQEEEAPGENDGQEAGNTDGQQEISWQHRRPGASYPTAGTRDDTNAASQSKHTFGAPRGVAE